MTERQGLFTVQTSLLLSTDNRMRLEQLVRERGGDAADVISQIIAERRLDQLPADGAVAGEMIHVRLYLTPEQRQAFEAHLAANELHLSTLVSLIATEYLSVLPEARPAPPPPLPVADIARRRADLARLRARRDAAGKHAPLWLHAYIAQVEAELRRLERVA